MNVSASALSGQLHPSTAQRSNSMQVNHNANTNGPDSMSPRTVDYSFPPRGPDPFLSRTSIDPVLVEDAAISAAEAPETVTVTAVPQPQPTILNSTKAHSPTSTVSLTDRSTLDCPEIDSCHTASADLLPSPPLSPRPIRWRAHPVLAPGWAHLLPANILEMIFIQLSTSLTDLAKVGQVCMRWNSIVRDAPELWQLIVISGKQHHLLPELSNFLKRSASLPVDLDITLSGREPEGIARKVLAVLRHTMHRVRALTLHIDTSVFVGRLLETALTAAAPLLERLKIDFPSPFRLMDELFQGEAPRLYHLSVYLRNTYADRLVSGRCAGLAAVTHLVSLDEDAMPPLNYRYTRLLLAQLPNLEHVELCSIPFIVVDKNEERSLTAKPLKSLAFIVPKISRSHLHAMSALRELRFTDVERIVVYDAPAQVVTELMQHTSGEVVNLTVLFTSRPGITHVFWRDTRGFTRIFPSSVLHDSIFRELGSGPSGALQSLEHLTISEYMPKAEVEDVDELLREQSLQKLSVMVRGPRAQGGAISFAGFTGILNPATLKKSNTIRYPGLQSIELRASSDISEFNQLRDVGEGVEFTSGLKVHVDGLLGWLRTSLGYTGGSKRLGTLALCGVSLQGQDPQRLCDHIVRIEQLPSYDL